MTLIKSQLRVHANRATPKLVRIDVAARGAVGAPAAKLKALMRVPREP